MSNSQCLTGLTSCNRACVNENTDNNNCGGCSSSALPCTFNGSTCFQCGSGKGCSNGSCVTATVFAPPASCSATNPPIQVTNGGSENVCAGNLAQTTFRWGVCDCSSFSASQDISVDAFDSSKAGYPPALRGGGVGINGSFGAQTTTLSGDLWCANDANNLNNASPSGAGSYVEGDVHVKGALNGKGLYVGDRIDTPNVASDVYVTGGTSGITNTGSTAMHISGNVYDCGTGGACTAPTTKSGSVTIDGATYPSPVASPKAWSGTIAEPCVCGAPTLVPDASVIDVDGIVAYHKGGNCSVTIATSCVTNANCPNGESCISHNDNAAIGLDPNLYCSAIIGDCTAIGAAPARLDLPCGNYYLNSFNTSTPTTIYAHGNTAIYIGSAGGTSMSAHQLYFGLDPTAQLDIFVGANSAGVGGTLGGSTLSLGSPNYPALTRFYYGSYSLSNNLTNTVHFSQQILIDGEFYAPKAELKWSQATAVFGAVFAGSMSLSQKFNLHYDRAVLGIGADCPRPTGGSGGGANTCGGTGCCTCNDCFNQACIINPSNNGTCGPDGANGGCKVNSDCCSPLVCDVDGFSGSGTGVAGTCFLNGG